MICYASLNVITGFEALREEVTSLLKNKVWITHYNKIYFEGGWDVLPLRAPDGDSLNPFADQMQHSSFKNTPLLDELPGLKKFIDDWPCEKLSARLLNLKAGSIIKQHRDNELAFEYGEVRLHIPIITNADVAFYLNDELVTMKEGECWYINANLPHRVANNGLTDRIHLVIDCKVNLWVRDLMRTAQIIKKIKDYALYSTDQLKEMISVLRSHDTETSSALADDLQKQL